MDSGLPPTNILVYLLGHKNVEEREVKSLA